MTYFLAILVRRAVVFVRLILQIFVIHFGLLQNRVVRFARHARRGFFAARILVGQRAPLPHVTLVHEPRVDRAQHVQLADETCESVKQSTRLICQREPLAIE